MHISKPVLIASCLLVGCAAGVAAQSAAPIVGPASADGPTECFWLASNGMQGYYLNAGASARGEVVRKTVKIPTGWRPVGGDAGAIVVCNDA